MPADSAAGSAGSAAVVWKTGFSEELFSNCVRTQAGLLRKALELLPPGGELVYSTCSILPEENELLVQRVLEEAAHGRAPAVGRKVPAVARAASMPPTRQQARFARTSCPLTLRASRACRCCRARWEGALCIRPERAVRRVLRLPSSPPVGAGRSSGRMAGALAESARWGHGQTCRSRAPAVLAAQPRQPRAPAESAARTCLAGARPCHILPTSCTRRLRWHRGRVQWTASPSEDAAWERGPSYVLQPGKP